MKVLLVALLICSAYAWPGFANDASSVSLAKRQQDVNRLLYKVTEPIFPKFTELKDVAKNFKPEEHASAFKDNGAAAKRLTQDINDNLVTPRHHLFSLFNAKQRAEAIQLFEVLLNSNDWNCFASCAAHYRELMNEGEFVYALYVAVIHSDLGEGIVLPPLYEVTPHMFTNSEVINKAYAAKMTQTPGKFHMDFTGSKKNPEQRVAYFGEDIGLNVHHVTWHMDFPFWWKDSYANHIDRKGELFFWAHHQLTARFDAERLSNGLNMVDELYWDKKIKEGFAPHTTYKYGGEFPARSDNVEFADVDGVARIRDMIIMESRVRDAIAHGYIVDRQGKNIDISTEKGINILGNVIESSNYSPNTGYYGALHNTAHMVLGRQADPQGKYNMPPGVMEHFETATRDPSFFRLHKYIDNIFKEHKNTLPAYKKEELIFESVAINGVEIDGKLETFFEDFEFSLLNAVDSTPDIKDVDISAIVSRINHEPFTVNIDATNNGGSNVLGTIRMYLCPSRDHNDIPFSFNEGRWHCIEMDKFWTQLTPGDNHISRKSTDASSTVPDRPSFRKIWDMTNDAVDTGKEIDTSKFTRGCGIPNRMLLPKGNTEGMKFALLVGISDGQKDAAVDGLDKSYHGSHTQCGIHGEKYPDNKPLGYPLDRQIPDEREFFNVPNFFMKKVKITHREH